MGFFLCAAKIEGLHPGLNTRKPGSQGERVIPRSVSPLTQLDVLLKLLILIKDNNNTFIAAKQPYMNVCVTIV